MSQYEPREGHHHHHHGNPTSEPTVQTYATDQGAATTNATDLKKHKHGEEGAGLGGLAAGAYALHEGHEAKKDPEHARRHKLEEEVAGTGAVGAEGLALYEHHKDHKDKKQLEQETGEKKHHGLFK